MILKTLSPRRFSQAFAALATAGTLILAGCGSGFVPNEAIVTPAVFTGSVHGGESPIVYSKVSFYETAAITTSGTGATGTATGGVYKPTVSLTALGSTFTDTNGNFSFTTPLACTSSADYVYATAAGGNAGGGSLNPNVVLMAAVGSCSGFGGSTSVVINELSTVAAAYALSGFTSVTGTYTTALGAAVAVQTYAIVSGAATIAAAGSNLTAGQPVTVAGFTTSTFLNGSYNVISATANSFTVATNHADTAGSVTESGGMETPTVVSTIPAVSVVASTTNYIGAATTVGTTTTYAPTPANAAGLAHAFANAFNLINPAVAVANSTTSTGAIVPTTLINTLGNILQGCVNSNGGAASSTATAGCPALFYNTSLTTNTATSTGGANSATTSTPTNTLQAVLNIAHAPTANVAALFAVAPTTAAFNPALATAPADFSIAIAYPKLYGNTNTASTSCYTAALGVSGSETGLCYPYAVGLDANDNVFILNETGSTSVASNVISLSSSGAVRFVNALDTTNVNPIFIAADSLGNVFYPNNTSSTTSTVLEISGSTGAQTATQPGLFGVSFPYGIAIDTANNLYVTTGTATASNIYKYTATASATPALPTYGTPTLIGTDPSAANRTYQISLDPSTNYWVSQYNTTTAAFSVVLPAASATEIAATGTGSSLSAYGITTDAFGNAWADGTATITKLVPTVTPITGVAETVAATYTPGGGTASLRYMNMDGNNNVLVVDNNTTNSGLIIFPTTNTSQTLFKLKPCISNAGTTCPTLSSSTNGIYGPRIAQADSTGSVWVASSTNGNIVQVIGAAAPSWPLLAVQKPGLMP